MQRCLCAALCLLLGVAALPAQEAPAAKGVVARGVDYFYDFLSMAGASTAKDFRPQSQAERNADYRRTITNPLFFFKGALSGATDQWKNKPEEWGQGWGPYGQRVGHIVAQYAIQKTVTFGLASALHEDNRYFGSGRKGVWTRTAYAMSSSVLARHDDGRRSVSISQLAGFSSSTFLSRLWQPESTGSAGDAAVSFGISMGGNVAISVVKEFLPDIVRRVLRRTPSPLPETAEQQKPQATLRPEVWRDSQ